MRQRLHSGAASVLLVLALVLQSRLLAAQSVIRVPADQPTIGAALSQAASGTAILVSAGTYLENIIWPAVDGIRLIAVEGATKTTIDGRFLGSVIYVGANLTRATVIEGFSIVHGESENGAGLRLQSSIVVRDNHIMRCRAVLGRAARGVGIFVGANRSPRIERNVIHENTTQSHPISSGGGIYLGVESGAEIVGNVITENRAVGSGPNRGGGICIEVSNNPGLLVANNVIARNVVSGSTSARGGGVFFVGGVARVIGNTIQGNRCTAPLVNADGGGILFGSGTTTGTVFKNNIVARNVGSGASGAGGVGCEPGAVVAIDYNDVWMNTPTDFGGCSAGPNGISADPLFGTVDFDLSAASPCLDAGDPATFQRRASVDFHGDPRRLDGNFDGPGGNGARVDIGADEFSIVRLEALGVAVMGGTLDLEVDSRTAANYAIGISAARSGALIAPFGDLLLAPPIGVLRAGVAPATPRVFIPRVPTLDGVPIHLQALVYRTLGGTTLGQFTNRLDLTLSARSGIGIVERFSNRSQFATGTAAWTPNREAGLFATYGYGGNGHDGSLVVSGAVVLDADTRAPAANGLVEWNFQELDVRPNGVLVLKGKTPIRINVIGTCTIDGSIVASGNSGQRAPAGQAANVGRVPGGTGGPGAGSGGDANTKPTNPIGALPADLRGGPGWPKANRCGDLNKSDNRFIGPVEPNCGGGMGGNRGLPFQSQLRSGCSGNGGGHRFSGYMTDFLCGNINSFGREFGVRWIVPTGAGAVQQPTAGTGGGAGGNAAVSLLNPTPPLDIVAGSGGGGGGGCEVVAVGALTANGSIVADGGSGGVGSSTIVGNVTISAGYGGGGSGGSIWLSGTSVTLSNQAKLSALGGAGNPSPPNPPRTGDGGDGYIIVRDLSGSPALNNASILPAPILGRERFAPQGNGRSDATSMWYRAVVRNPLWSFDANNPQTGVVVPGNDLTFATPPQTGQRVTIVFQGAPDVNGQPDPNPANWVPANAFTPDIRTLAGRQLRHIRFKVSFDTGPVTGLPAPSQIAISKVAMRY